MKDIDWNFARAFCSTATEGSRLVLTESGLGLLEHAQAMVSAVEGMALAAAGQAGRVGISASDAFAADLLPDIIARIRPLSRV